MDRIDYKPYFLPSHPPHETPGASCSNTIQPPSGHLPAQPHSAENFAYLRAKIPTLQLIDDGTQGSQVKNTTLLDALRQANARGVLDRLENVHAHGSTNNVDYSAFVSLGEERFGQVKLACEEDVNGFLTPKMLSYAGTETGHETQMAAVKQSVAFQPPSLSQPWQNAPSHHGPSAAQQRMTPSHARPPDKRKHRRHKGIADEQILAHLHSANGSLKSKAQVGSELRAAGRGAADKRIAAQVMAAAGGRRSLPSATDEQIRAHLHKADGSLRYQSEVVSSLHDAGWGASSSRIAIQHRAAAGTGQLPAATAAQISAHLSNSDGSLSTRREVARRLRAAGYRAASARIDAQLKGARGPRRNPTGTDEQIRAHLYRADGSLRWQSEVASTLRASGWGASYARISALHSEAHALQ